MKIAGLQKTSLIDYPNFIVSIIFTQGCNFNCPYCHNSSLIPRVNDEASYMPPDYLFNFLNKRKGLIDGVSITGGEPTLQADLIDLVKKIKDLDLKIKIDTNGTNPMIINKLIREELIDYIAMDIKAPLEKYPIVAGIKSNKLITKIKESITLIMKSNIDYEFRTTVVPGLIEEKDFEKIGKLIKGAKIYYIQNFRNNNTLGPTYREKSSFPPSILKKFKDIIKAYVREVKIRE